MFTTDTMQAALSFVNAQASHIEPGVYARKFPQIQYRDLVPVDTSAHPFAKTVTYYSTDSYGAAKFINGNSNDVPMAGSEREQHETDVHTAGIGYGYGWEEIGQAQMLGIPFNDEKAAAARRASEEFADAVALYGDTDKGYQGLFNSTAVTLTTPNTGAWASASAAEILADANKLITSVGTGTRFISMADTLVLPDEALNIMTTSYRDGSDVTILETFVRNNAYTARTGRPLLIRTAHGLSTAGASSASRMVAYRRDPEVLKLHMPMPHRFLPAQPNGALNVIIPGVFRLGGLDIRLPKEVRYMDGV